MKIAVRNPAKPIFYRNFVTKDSAAMEKLMQYVWQHRLWPCGSLRTVDGRKVDVIDPGLINTDAGPDFFNAKVEIGGELWAGNVEIHVRASDWMRHGHHTDRAYDSVILHVVERDDMAVRRPDGRIIPQVVMPAAADFHKQYMDMVHNPATELPCAAELQSVPSLHITDWLSSLAFERLYEKVDRIENLLSRNHGSWADTAYIVLARALGFGINSLPFERLAASLPMKTMMKHRDSPTSVEALLFGQAGLLDNQSTDPYTDRLRREYTFLANKFGLTPLDSPGWKMARMRPQNFPHRRVAALAAYITSGFMPGYAIYECDDIAELEKIFSVELPDYWKHHYHFGPAASSATAALSRSSIRLLIINVAIPLIFARGAAIGDRRMQDRAISLWQSLPAESNAIITLFGKAGLECRDAFTSQALIQLRRAYCEPRKCLYCRIGHRLLAAKAIRK